MTFLVILAMAAVAGVLVILFGQAKTRRWWWWRDADWEQVVGLLVLMAVVGSFALTVVMLFFDGTSGSQPGAARVLLSLLAIGLTLFVASKQWTRKHLRLAGLLLVFCLSLVIVDVGREALEREPAQQAVEELAAAKRSLDELDPTAKELREQVPKKRRDSLKELAAAIGPVRAANAELANRAEGVHARLQEAAGKELLEAEVARFDALYRPNAASQAELKLRHTVDAALAAVRTEPPLREKADETLVTACVVAKGKKAEIPKGLPCTKAPTGDSLGLAMARARLEVATYRQAVLGRDEDKTAVKTLAKELEKAEAVALGGREEKAGGDEKASVVDSLRKGGEVVVSGLPGQQRSFQLTMEAMGWALLGALALGFWRWIERRSGQQMPGPITEITLTEANAPAAQPPAAPAAGGPPNSPSGGAAGASGKDAQKLAFRTALLKNLPERATAPGAEAMSSITDLVELVGAGAGALGKAAKAVKNVITKPEGYVVTGDAIAPEEPGRSWQVLVRISDQSTGHQIAVETLFGDTATASCRAGGYWAAASLLSRSSRIPTWARWEEGSAESLAVYDYPGEVPKAELAKALGLAPTSGVLLQELGNRCELEGKQLEALELYARAVVVHPRYRIARYRMAASVAMLADAVEEQWMNASLNRRKRVTDQLQRACDRLGIDTADLKLENDETKALAELPAADGPEAKELFAALAKRLFDRLVDDAKWPRLLARTLRRSERVVWYPEARSLLQPHGRANLARWLVRSIRLKDESECESVEKRAKKPGSWWQLSYNLACYHARNANPEPALQWLETALERPGSQQMGVWVGKDPDLKTLRGHPRFERVLGQLPKEKKKG